MESDPQLVVAKGELTKEARDSLKSFFHLLVGKPDSTQQIFPRPIDVNLESLIDLNERVYEKLSSHHVDGLNVSVDAAFEDNYTMEFGSFTEFREFRWTTPRITREIRIRWQFLLSIRGFELPQQHALSVKICSDAKPIELLQAILSKHPAEDDNVAMSMAPLVCRVDFISPTLGQELVAVVGEWSKTLPSPAYPNKLVRFSTRNKRLIENIITHTLPVLIALLSISTLGSLFPPDVETQFLTITKATQLMAWLMYSLICIYLAQKFARFLAQSAISSAQKVGTKTFFSLTNGDGNRRRLVERSSQKNFRNFLLSTGFAFVLNVLAGLFTAILFSGGS
jgi:hypothetical protein